VRRWAAAVFSGIVFLGTVALSLLVIGDEARRYFSEVLGDTSRVGPIGTSFNQSWRGGISRILGHDAGFGPAVLTAIAVTAVLALLAWRALGSGQERDRLGSLLVVQLCGLVLAPISWTHHWVWAVPLIIWFIHGPWREMAGARLLGWGWLGLMLVGGPNLLYFAQPSIWDISRPWYLAWAGLIYIVALVVTLGWIAMTGIRIRRNQAAAKHPSSLTESGKP
jgi:alpha-1,2-mannosyltransferase